jgi:hypothetical protein
MVATFEAIPEKRRETSTQIERVRDSSQTVASDAPAIDFGAITTLVSDAPIERPFRYEVTNRGASWIWRRGSKAEREGYYGGTIETLPEWRRDEYERNKQRRKKGKANRAGRRTGNAPKRS